MRLSQFKRISIIVGILFMLSACATNAPAPTLQGPIVPTRIPTAAPTAVTPSITPSDLNILFPIRNTGTLSFDQPFTSRITDEDYAALLTFEAQAGQTIDIITQAEDGEVDTYLILRAPDGRELARNDDRELDNRDAALYGIDLPETGVYTVIVTRFRQRYGASSGGFTVELREAEGGFPPTDASKLISYGVEQYGTINDNNLQEVYTFEGAAGDIITATVRTEGGDLDPTIRLTDAAGNELAVNSDINRITDSDAELTEVTLPQDGYYGILVTRYNGIVGTTAGQYALSIESVGKVPPGDLREQLNAVLGFNESSTLLEQNLDMYVPEYGFFVGDIVDERHGEVLGQTVLTFYLVPAPDDVVIQRAELALRRCVEDGLGFDVLEGIDIFTDPIDELTAQVDFEPSDEAILLGSIDQCSSIDITEIVQDAYDTQRQRITLRLMPQNNLENQQNDAIIFTDPRLLITVDE